MLQCNVYITLDIVIHILYNEDSFIILSFNHYIMKTYISVRYSDYLEDQYVLRLEQFNLCEYKEHGEVVINFFEIDPSEVHKGKEKFTRDGAYIVGSELLEERIIDGDFRREICLWVDFDQQEEQCREIKYSPNSFACDDITAGKIIEDIKNGNYNNILRYSS